MPANTFNQKEWPRLWLWWQKSVKRRKENEEEDDDHNLRWQLTLWFLAFLIRFRSCVLTNCRGLWPGEGSAGGDDQGEVNSGINSNSNSKTMIMMMWSISAWPRVFQITVTGSISISTSILGFSWFVLQQFDLAFTFCLCLNYALIFLIFLISKTLLPLFLQLLQTSHRKPSYGRARRSTNWPVSGSREEDIVFKTTTNRMVLNCNKSASQSSFSIQCPIAQCRKVPAWCDGCR